MTTGELNILSKALEKEELKRAVNILKEAGPDKVKAAKKLPYINQKGVLVIPFDSEPRYHWWAGGQTILETLRGLKASLEIIAMYVPGGAA